MLEQQNSCCAICNVHQDTTGKKLYVDHDHSTGVVRQLLCQHCNLLIGFAKEDINLLYKAIEYMNKH